MPTFTLHIGDSRNVLAQLPDNSIDSVVTDPPYELTANKKGGSGEASASTETPYGRARITTGGGFMGQQWDATGVAFDTALWAEVLRVLKPGGHLLAFGGTRTYHRMAVAIEDAGFEIRDSLHWVYGSGFPKSMNVGKAIDKAAGAERQVVGTLPAGHGPLKTGHVGPSGGGMSIGTERSPEINITVPATPEAERWEGWGTALKPAHEPIVVARKPLSGTVAANVLEHGTGALNIDGCRIAGTVPSVPQPLFGVADGVTNYGAGTGRNGEMSEAPDGRWPANVVLTHHHECRPAGTTSETVGGGAAGTSGFAAGYASGDGFVGREVEAVVWDCHPECPIAVLDAQSGDLAGGAFPGRANAATGGMYEGGWGPADNDGRTAMDSGGASRYFQQTAWDWELDGASFQYVPKPSKAERNFGLGDAEERRQADRVRDDGPGGDNPRNRSNTAKKNFHPTVKPVALMQHLVRLVTPPGGTVLDPFTGSGTTGVAAMLEGFDFVGVEMSDEYAEQIARPRIGKAKELAERPFVSRPLVLSDWLDDDDGSGQMSLF